jgi:hypothetical protein
VIGSDWLELHLLCITSGYVPILRCAPAATLPASHGCLQRIVQVPDTPVAWSTRWPPTLELVPVKGRSASPGSARRPVGNEASRSLQAAFGGAVLGRPIPFLALSASSPRSFLLSHSLILDPQSNPSILHPLLPADSAQLFLDLASAPASALEGWFDHLEAIFLELPRSDPLSPVSWPSPLICLWPNFLLLPSSISLSTPHTPTLYRHDTVNTPIAGLLCKHASPRWVTIAQMTMCLFQGPMAMVSCPVATFPASTSTILPCIFFSRSGQRVSRVEVNLQHRSRARLPRSAGRCSRAGSALKKPTHMRQDSTQQNLFASY